MEQLIQQLLNAQENKDCFIELCDWNMVKAWNEQIEFIEEKIRKEMKWN